ncbi:hypothetical protein Bbelb_369120 [Branchiostoma belcheri]|nr:hypothetical protein Bbelb_369120 [Branchiostoma belcheri]
MAAIESHDIYHYLSACKRSLVETTTFTVKKHKAVTRRKKRQLPTTTTNYNDDTAEPVFFLQAQQSTRVSIHETLAVALAGNPGVGGKRSELISALTLKNSGFPV